MHEAGLHNEVSLILSSRVQMNSSCPQKKAANIQLPQSLMTLPVGAVQLSCLNVVFLFNIMLHKAKIKSQLCLVFGMRKPPDRNHYNQTFLFNDHRNGRIRKLNVNAGRIDRELHLLGPEGLNPATISRDIFAVRCHKVCLDMLARVSLWYGVFLLCAWSWNSCTCGIGAENKGGGRQAEWRSLT